jgi:arylsulfatase A
MPIKNSLPQDLNAIAMPSRNVRLTWTWRERGGCGGGAASRKRETAPTTALAALLTLFAVAGAQAADRPNIVFFLIDDLGWRDLGCYGSTFYETPNVDRLAQQGVRFTQAYAACPVCSPTRASILTGRYPARLGLTDWIPGRKQWPTARLLVPSFKQQLPLEEVTLAEGLAPAGYVSASIGKWHLGSEPFFPERQGFALNVAGSLRGSPASYFSPFDLPGLRVPEPGEYLPERLTREAEAFIEKNRDRPFFLYFPHFSVHLPLQAQKETIAKYQARARPGAPQRNAVYGAMVESMDASVGRVMAKLDQLGIADRTIVFFTSDNGGLVYEGSQTVPVTSNEPLRAGKGHVYEGGIRVPLIVRWPGVARPGSRCDASVSSVDYFPTALQAAGVSASGVVDGASIVSLIAGRRPAGQRALYWHYPHYSNQGGEPAAAVRRGSLKLIEFYEDGRLELYDLARDPGERNDLARSRPAAARELKRLLDSWRRSVGAVLPAANPAFDPSTADQGLTGKERRPH